MDKAVERLMGEHNHLSKGAKSWVERGIWWETHPDPVNDTKGEEIEQEIAWVQMEGEEGVILKMSDLQRCMFDRLRGCGVFPSNFLESSLLYQDVFLAVKHYRCSTDLYKLKPLRTEQHHFIKQINWTVNL